MNVNDIDEAENLILKYRTIMDAKRQIDRILSEEGGYDDSFILVDRGSGMEISLPNLKTESLESIMSVLNDQYDKIVSRLRKI